MYNFIELQKFMHESIDGAELWIARAHHDGHIVEGYALSGPDSADFFDSDPRGQDPRNLGDGLRLPAYHLDALDLSWNVIAAACDGDGLDPIEEDFPVALIPLEDFPGWLEIARPGGDTIYILPDGRSTSLRDWIVPFPEPSRDREGIAVPADILRYL